MKERPILFSVEMVRAILDGRKYQTRRILKVQPLDILPMKGDSAGKKWVTLDSRAPEPEGNHGSIIGCRYGVPGDRLWVRETFSNSEPVIYRATLPPGIKDSDCVWKPSIFMPREFSRLMLEIVSVRVERLQAITIKDVWAEGIKVNDVIESHGGRKPSDIIQTYADLWNKINGKYAWMQNPFIWVIEFRKVTA